MSYCAHAVSVSACSSRLFLYWDLRIGRLRSNRISRSFPTIWTAESKLIVDKVAAMKKNKLFRTIPPIRTHNATGLKKLLLLLSSPVHSGDYSQRIRRLVASVDRASVARIAPAFSEKTFSVSAPSV